MVEPLLIYGKYRTNTHPLENTAALIFISSIIFWNPGFRDIFFGASERQLNELPP